MLVDTSVWIEHLRRRHSGLAGLLVRGEVHTHPFVIGELACGRMARRAEVLALLGELPGVLEATHEEALQLIANHDLEGGGLGWVDVHLLASARLAGLPLLTLDRRLADAARQSGIDTPD